MDDKTPEARSRNMSRIRSEDSSAELMVRKTLFSLGCRFRLHKKDLPGHPDVVMAGRRAAIFVYGCFWHRHRGCRYATTPKTNTEYWLSKLTRNALRDRMARDALLTQGWRVLWIWECGVKKKSSAESLAEFLNAWLKSSETFTEYPY